MASKYVLSQIDELIAQAKGIDAKLLRDAAENNPRDRSLYSRGDLAPGTMERIRELDMEALEQQERRSTVVKPAKEPERLGRRPLSEHLAISDPLIKAHIQGLATLRENIELMIKNEGRRDLWSGFWVNALFFIIGLAVSAVYFSKAQLLALVGAG
jgi:hypothetical protein